MDRPLWQILLSIFALSFALHRVAVAAALGTSGGPHLLVVAQAAEAAVGLAADAGIGLGRPWVLGAIAVLGVTAVATALLGGLVFEARPATVAIGQSAVAALACGALFAVLRHELGSRLHDERSIPKRDRSRASARRAPSLEPMPVFTLRSQNRRVAQDRGRRFVCGRHCRVLASW
jgi:hypothetical protein